MFSYIKNGDMTWSSDYSEYPPFSSAEPLRFKVVTARIFLDIPINEFPDFSHVGGDDYVTLPWPYTTPVIGGISEDRATSSVALRRRRRASVSGP